MRRKMRKILKKKERKEWGKNRMVVLEAAENVDLAKLFEIDTLLPQEYQDSMRSRVLESEKKLMLAILEDAVHCFQKYIRASGRVGMGLFQDANEWFYQLGDANHLFSFENVCAHLGFDPAYIRKGLDKWRENALKNPSAQEKVRGRYHIIHNRAAA